MFRHPTILQKTLHFGILGTIMMGLFGVGTVEAANARTKSTSASATPAAPSTPLCYYVADLKTGEKLGGSNENYQIAPASIIKLLTCLIATEKLPLDGIIMVGRSIPKVSPRKLGIQPGEQFRVIDLITGALVHSANDCATALGEACAGTEEDFAVLMNERAKELGMKNSHFVRTSGLAAAGQTSTAEDVALLVKAAYENKTMRAILENPPDEMTDRDGKVFRLVETNPLLLKGWPLYGKTGFTNQSMFCFAGWYDGKIIVMLHCNRKDERDEALIGLMLSANAVLPEDASNKPNTLVAQLQKIMQEKKQYKGAINGEMTDETRAAFKKLQISLRAHADGVIGPETIKALGLAPEPPKLTRRHEEVGSSTADTGEND